MFYASFTPKNADKYMCKFCDFICSKNSDWTRHISTLKHKRLITANDFTPKNATSDMLYNCICGKQYKHLSSLCKHKKICINQNQIVNVNINSSDNYCDNYCDNSNDNDNTNDNTNDNELSDKEIIKMLIKENSEFKHLILEIVKKDTQTINNNTNCNNINNSFNLNVFLNEKCKDAINISDFVGNIKMKMTDLENVGHLGYVEGVSRILIKNLKDLDIYSRPIHCSDFKREVLYIKDNDKWTKETDDKYILKNAIKEVANKNIKQIQVWKQANPDCTESESKKNDQYINIVMNSMSGGTIEEQQNNISQIVKNISKVVVIDK